MTLKRALVTSELPIVATFADAQIGVVTHGTVSKIMDAGVIVDFFGGLRALVPAKEAASVLPFLAREWLLTISEQ